MRPIVTTTTDATSGATTSPLVYLDPWVQGGQVTVQTVVTGTVNYNVQYSMDDPNSPTNPVASGSMTWTDSGQGAKTGTNTFQFASFTPVYIRVIQNTGSGSTSTTVLQSGSVTF